MKRDMDLIRKILLACEAHPHGLAPQPLQIDGHSNEEVGFHIHLLIQAGLLNGTSYATSSTVVAQDIVMDRTPHFGTHAA